MGNQVTLILPGRKEAQAVAEPNPFLDIKVIAQHRVDATARGVAQPPEGERATNADASDIVEMEFENGVKRWMPIARLPQEVQPLVQRGLALPNDDPSVIRVPATLGAVGETRGLKEFALKTVKVLGLPSPEEWVSDLKALLPTKALANMTARFVAQLVALKFDGGRLPVIGTPVQGKLAPGPGLYRFPNPQQLCEGDRIGKTSELPGGSDAFLLFLHGTFSSAPGAFFALGPTDEWKKMQRRYGNRIIAFNHPTLSVSPIVNTLELAKLLPEKAKLHLVSHSRGGLIGELLALPKVKDLDALVAPFAEATDFPEERKQDEKLLRELSAVLAQKQFQIERFVRVACPARGTLLASDRLDTYVSALLNAMGLGVNLTANPAIKTAYDFAKAFVLALLKCKASPADLPGLEAQRPVSPLIHILNRPGLETKADLSVISGDIEGEGVLGNVIAGVSNTFFLQQHDLVVNTDSMDGGLERESVRKLFDQGPTVAHSNYFVNQKTRQALWSWLDKLEGTGTVQPARGVQLDVKAPAAAARGTAATGRPVVFLLPGIMGSHLKDARGRIWLDPSALALGGMGRLGLEIAGIKPDGVIGTSYQGLIEFLSPYYDVQIFAYDWRRSLKDSAELLADEVKKALDDNLPVSFLAHSMGGLVTRALIAYHGDVWQRVRQLKGRLVMLGTPNQGSFAIPCMLIGQERLLRLLSLFDFKHDLKALTGLISSYPGLLEMLPDEYFEAAKLQTLNPLSLPTATALANAKATREALRTAAVEVESMVYVAGAAAQTPCRIELENGKPVVIATPLGDGRVTYESGKLGGVRTWYADAEHGDLASYEAAFPALLDLLKEGTTNKLSEKPRAARGAVVETVLRQEDVERQLFPKPEEIIRAALGSALVKRPRSRTLRLTVTHGDLRYASHPVAVGHYNGDAIISAEAALNNRLDQRLKQRFDIGLYPGPTGTAEVLRVPGKQPPGALIIGLGDVGEITPEKVRNGVARAALRYALMIMDDSSVPKITAKDGSQWRSAAFSMLLLGTYGGQALSIESSVIAMVQGAIQANRELQAQGLWQRVRVDEIEIIELYEDMALEAMRTAQTLVSDPPRDLFGEEQLKLTNSILIKKEGGRFYRPANQHANGWPRRVQITGRESGNCDELLSDLRFLALTDRTKDEDVLATIRRRLQGETTGEPKIKDLNFLALTDRARAEDTLQATQRRLVDQLVAAAVNSPTYDARLGTTLFELLIPNALKEQTDAQSNLVLVVDSEAAQYPWELLAERTRTEPQPLALEKRLIRQFKTANFRPNPRMARDQYLLVIGDPLNDFSELPGARREAEIVATKLGQYYEDKRIITRIGPEHDATTIINELFAREYNLIHLAGHGDYQPNDPTQSGMVLNNGLRLTAAELRQLRTVPELVFINCCHLGRIDQKLREPNRLAASIAEELIRMGVKAVVAAGWAVDDRAAQTFAEVFYDQMLKGREFGEAVLRARQIVQDQHRGVNTWGAYQCYGNPGFTLTQSQARIPWIGGQTPQYFSSTEYRDRLQQMAFDARTEAEQRNILLQQVAELRRTIPPALLDGSMLGLFGQTCRDLGDFKAAVTHYREALMAEVATVSLQDVEQLANLESRYAQQTSTLDAQAAETDWEPRSLLEKSNQRLENLLAIGHTKERLSLRAGNHKRLARLTQGEERRTHLKQAAESYQKAHELALKTTGTVDYYPALNWIACALLLTPPRRRKGQAETVTAEWLNAIDGAERSARKQVETAPSFWNRVTPADAELYRLLVQGKLTAASAPSVIELYRQAFAMGATQSEIASVLDQLDFLIEMLSTSKQAERQTALRVLKRIRGKLAEDPRGQTTWHTD